MKKGTSKVTASVSGGTPKTMIFIYSGPTSAKYPEIERTQGNNQIGATDARLEEPLAVKVTDGNNRPLAGVAVSFATENQSGDGSMFIPVPGTTVYTTTNTDLVNNTVNTTEALSNTPAPSATIWVQTDRSGVAQVYYQLSDARDSDGGGAHQVTAALQGSSLTTTFDATAVDAQPKRASLVVVSGTPQSSDAATHDVEDPLVVRVRRPGGYRIADVRIRFTALTGGT